MNKTNNCVLIFFICSPIPLRSSLTVFHIIYVTKSDLVIQCQKTKLYIRYTIFSQKSYTLRFNVQLHSYPVLYFTVLRSVHFPGTSHKQAVRLRVAQPYVSSQVREAYPRW